ncbi:MAG: CBS domain-containing protein [Candidatus Bathyarchaeota archaeon]|nr:CBS domain-containing protein [Candidatus Bathyarchaeota archaeon]
MALRVDDVMIKKVHTIEADYSTKQAARMMDYLRVSSLVVLSEGRVVGIITERDLVSNIVARAAHPEKVYIKDVMSAPVVTTRPNALLENAVQCMLKYGIKKLPVVAGEKDQDLVGIISLTDIARLHPLLYSRLVQYQDSAESQVDEKVSHYIE